MNILKNVKSVSMISILALALISFWACKPNAEPADSIDNVAFQQAKQDMQNRIDNKIAEADKEIAVINERISSRTDMTSEVKNDYDMLLLQYDAYKKKLNDKKTEVDMATEEEGLDRIKVSFTTWWGNTELEFKELKIKTQDAFTRNEPKSIEEKKQ